jgi:cytochrome b pre-mRNA-processing protein 3
MLPKSAEATNGTDADIAATFGVQSAPSPASRPPATARKHFVLDTNVLLHNAQSIFKFAEHEVVIPLAVIEELDTFKKNNDERGRNARHVTRALDRLRGQGEAADETSQALSERYVRGLDDAFRELGIGDVGLAKRMKALGQAFYGRLKAYSEGFAALPDAAPLRDVVARTALEGGEGDADALTAYVLRSREALASQPLEQLCAGVVSWESLS